MDYFGFKFDLQLFGDVDFPADGYYTVEANKVDTQHAGTDTAPNDPEFAGTYLHIETVEGVTTWTLGIYDGTNPYTEEIATIANDITLENLLGTSAENVMTVAIPATIGNLAAANKILCTDVGSFVEVSGLAVGATVAAKKSLASGAISVNGVAFTGINTGVFSNLVFTVGTTTTDVSASLGVEGDAVTTPATAGVSVKVGTTTYTTSTAAAVSIAYAGANLGELTAGSLTIGDGVVLVANTAEITNSTANAITVNAAGEVTGLVTGASFTTTVSTEDRTFTATASGVAVTGEEVAVYAGATKVDAKTSKVYNGTTELTPAAITLKLAEASAATETGKTEVKTYYALNSDGSVAETPVVAADYPAISGTVIGYFQVTTTFNGTGNPAVDVDFKGGTITAYSGEITVDATAIKNVKFTDTSVSPAATTTKQVKTIDITGISAAGTKDEDVTVTGLAVGTAVTSEDSTAKTVYNNGGNYTWASRTITLDADDVENNKTRYFTVTFNQGAGTITLADNVYVKPDGSYFEVVHTAGTADKAGSVKINYVQGANDPNLYGLTDSTGAALGAIFEVGDVAYVKPGVAGIGVASIDFDTRMTGVVNNVVVNGINSGIKLTDAGTAVTKDTTTPNVAALGTYDYGYTNAMEFDASSLVFAGEETTATATQYIVLTTDEVTRVKTMTLSPTASPDGINYGSYTFTKTKDEDGNVTVTSEYVTPGTGDGKEKILDDPGKTVTGKTTISLGGDKDVKTVNMTGYDKIVEVPAGLTTLTKDGAAYDLATAVTDGALVYDVVSAFAYGTDKAISFDGIWSSTATGTDTHLFYYQVTAATDKGVTTYTVYDKTMATTTSAHEAGEAVDLAKDNYFIATYDDNTGAIALTYHEGTTSAITAATLAAVGEAVKVNGATVDTETALTTAITKKLTLTETIPCDVTDLPKTVKTVDTKDVAGSDYAYKDTYNVTTTIALGTTNHADGEYYRVNVAEKDKGSKANYGVNTATLVKVTTNNGVPTTEELAANNYVKVTTTGNGSTISIQYLPATDSKKAYDFDGQLITLDPSKAAADATITIYGNEASPTVLDNAKFVIKSLTKDQSVDTASHGAGATAEISYQTSYAVAYTEEVDDEKGIKADGLKLTGTTGTTKYYSITKEAPLANGVVTYTVAYSASEPTISGTLIGYITINNGTDAGITVSYTGSDTEGDLSKIGEHIAIDASGAKETVTAIDLSNAGSQINYAVKDIRSGVEVLNPGTNDTYAQLEAVDLSSAKLVLGSDTEAYWTVSASGTISKSTTKPTGDDVNYFAVTKPKDSNAYTIEYVEAGNGTAFDLTKTTLNIDASGVAKNDEVTVDLSNGTRVVQYNITGAPAGLTVSNPSTTPAKTADTVSYASTFSAWPTSKGTYTYFTAAADSKGDPITELKVPAAAVTIDPEATAEKQKTYNKVTIDVSSGSTPTYTISVTGVKQTATGVLAESDTYRSIKEITVPSSYQNIDATALTQTNMVLAGVGTGDTVIVSGTSLANLTIKGTGSFTTKDVTVPATPVSTTYTASTTTGEISVQNGKGVDGTFVLSTAEGGLATMTASTPGVGGREVVTIESTAGDGKVNVTFEEGAIVSITGLEDGETVKVKNAGEANAYTYKYTYDSETGLVTRVNFAETETVVAGADSTTADIIDLNYLASATPLTTETFSWTNGTYYVSCSETAATIATGEGAAGTVESGFYIMAEVSGNELKLTPVTGTNAGTVNPNKAYTGTISVTAANGVAITYDKDADPAVAVLKADGDFTVAFTNVSDGSKFKNLGEDDKITTATLGKGDAVQVWDGATYASYTAAADGTTLVFDSNRLTSTTKLEDGKTVDSAVTLAKNTKILTGDGSTIALNDGASANGVEVVVSDGVIKSITGLTTTEAVTVKTYKQNKDGSYTYTDANIIETTIYTYDTATTVTKQVVKANGDTETSKVTLAKEGDDILNPSKTALTSLVAALDTGTTTSSTGYVAVTAGVAAVGYNTLGPIDLTNDTLYPDGTQFVRATVTKDAAVQKVELTALIWKNGELTTVGADASKISVTYNANNSTDVATVVSYDGSNDSFKAIKFENVADGSEFTGLSKGDTVYTAALPVVTTPPEDAHTGSVTINGTTYEALADGATFSVYAENSKTTYVIAGTLVTKDTVTVINDQTDNAGTPGDTTDDILAFTQKYTLTYTKGTAEGSDDGVKIVVGGTYGGEITSIKDLDDGEKVSILNGTTNKATTYERKGGYIYKTAEDGTVQGKAYTDPTLEVTGGYADLVSVEKDAFQWSDQATKGTSGYFLLSGKDTKTATVADQSAKTKIDYTNAGETYLVATVTTGGALTLKTQTVGANGALGGDTPLANTQAITVDGIAGRKITYARGAEKSITLNGIGAGSNISGAAGANDSITTAALKTTTYKADGSVDKAAETVTVFGKVYTAAADGVMSFSGASVTAGTFLLSGTGATATISSTTTDSDGNVTVMAVTYNKNTYTGAAANQNVAVTVANGRVTGITGLDANAVDAAAGGEMVTVVTTTTDKFGVEKTTTSTYTATQSTETGKSGQVFVTRDVDGTISTHTFANGKQNVLDSSAVWTTSSYVTTQDFNWKKTGYFKATLVVNKNLEDYNKYIATIVEQDGTREIPGTGVNKYAEGTIFLKVEATKASASSPSVISSMSLVKLESNGELAAYDAGTIGTVSITATGAGGLELPTHTNKLIITGAERNKSYSGLNAADSLESNTNGAFTVNGKKYEVTSAGFGLYGSGELEWGTFTIAPEGTAATATAIGSGKPVHNGDNNDNPFAPGVVLKSIVYTPGADNKDGVSVQFIAGGIASVTDLEAGEKVVLTQVKGTSMTTGVVTTITKDDDNIVTRSIAVPGISTPLTMTRTDNDPAADVLQMSNGTKGYVVSNKFDYGTTTAGRVGLFLVDGTGAASVVAQDAGLELLAGENYVMVDVSNASDNVTINTLAYLSTAGGLFTKAKGNTVLTKGVTLTAPEKGNLTLASGAAQLYTTYKVDPDDPTGETWIVDKDNTETKRTYGISVIGAVAGKSYSGFGEKDTVTGSLIEKDTITVNSKTFTLAGDNAILIRGDGKAINGVYTLGSGLDSAAAVTAAEADQFTAKVTGSVSTAVVKLTDGNVDSIKGLSAANQTATITSTNTKTGAVTTTAYTITAVDATSGDLTVKKEVTADGVKSTYTGTVGKNDSITDASWGAPTATLTSKFDWTSASGSGYFLTDVTDSSKKLGTIEVKPATTTAEVGKYYLKVALDGDGSVSGISLHKIKADGTPDSDVLASVTEGTINVTAPTTSPLKLDMSTVNAALIFNVTGAIAKSVVTMDNAKDTLTTATLAAGEFVTVNTVKVVSGKADKLEFSGAAGGLLNGVVQFDKTNANTAVTTTTGTITVNGGVAITTTEVPVVTVKNGIVETITGNTASDVAVLDTASGITATYGVNMASVALTGVTAGKDIVTAKLEKDARVSSNGTNQDWTVAEAGPLTLLAYSATTMQVSEGTVKFNSGAKASTNVYVGVTTAEYKPMVFTTGTGNASTITVKVEKGVITSITGLRTGDTLTYDSVTYKAKSSTVIEKTYTDKEGKEHTDTAYLSKVDGDIIGASYAVVSDADITNDETFEGQFSWMAVDGRSTGYFKINDGRNGSTATIAEQSQKSSPTAGKNATVKYVKANTAKSDGNANLQILSIGALQVTNTNGVTKVSETDASKILTATTRITVTAPTTAVNDVIPAVSYTKTYEDKYNVTINKVARNSVIAGLTANDKVTTNTLNAEVYTNGVLTTLAQRVTMTDGKGDSIVYVAGAKGTMEFVGEGASAEAASDSENRATLVNGTILLDTVNTYTANNKTAILAGSATGTDAADITVALDDSGTAAGEGNCTDKVIVTASKGKVTSITGLNTKGNKLTLTPAGGTAVTYEVLYIENELDANGVAIADKQTVMVSRTEGTDVKYASFSVGKNIYGELNSKGVMTNGYKDAAADTPTNTDKLWSDTGKTTQVVYVPVDTTGDPYTAAFAQGATDPIKAKEAERGKKYLAMTVKTTNGVSTIQKIEVAEVDATGAMKVVKNMKVSDALFNAETFSFGTFTINGANGDSAFAKINYTIPDGMPVNIQNAAIGSVITGAKGNEDWATEALVTTAVTDSYALAKGTVTLYKTVDTNEDGANDRTVETKVTYAFKSKGDSATIGWDGAKVSKLTNLETVGESVTIVETASETVDGVDHVGEKTTVYEVKTVNKVTSVYKTTTAIDGTKKVYKAELQGSTYDWVADPDTKLQIDLTQAEVTSDFDWTLAKRDTGYFEVATNNTSNVKALSKPVSIKVSDAKAIAKTYIAMKISGNGVVDSVKAVKFDSDTKNVDTTYGTMIDVTTKFNGVVNITAPTKMALEFDRSKVDTATTIDENATMAVTGALKNSWITNLALGDTVTTAKLNKPAYNSKTDVWTTEGVGIGVADDENGAQWFKAGAAGALSFKVQEVEKDNKQLTLTSGTLRLSGGEYAYVGNSATGARMITMTAGSITLTASTNSKTGVTTYTIGELKEGEQFTIETFGGSKKTYWRSANNLFCEVESGSTTTKAVYEIKTGATVKSSVLELADSAGAAATKSNPWVSVTESNATFKETADEGLKLTSTVKNAAVTVDLKLLDSRIASDNNLYKTDVDYWGAGKDFGTGRGYDFIIDKYMANPAKFNGAASVVAAANLLDMQQVIGTRVAGAGKTYRAYDTNAMAWVDIAQNIKVTNGWTAIGSLQNDTITGASSGEDWLDGNAGNDSLVGGGAKDTFIVGAGQDTIKSYATGKDTITGAGAFTSVNLSGTDVLLWNDVDEDGKYDEGEDGVLVLGMGNKKAVNIGGTNYFFGSGKATKAETFTFDVSGTDAAVASVYHGKEGLANVVSIGTDKTKATSKTLGNTLTVDLSDATRYFNIAVADASKSGNKVDLKATDLGSTLKGGTYQSTLRGGLGSDSLVGGSGVDTFWFEALDGSDTISGFAGGKDKVYVKEANIVFSDKDMAAGDVALMASGTDVVLTDAEGKNTVKLTKAADATKAINIVTDAVTKETLSYYVGASTGKKANAFTATLDKDMAVKKDGDGKDTDELELKSYYVGSDSKLDDALKLASGKTVVANKKFNMNDLAGHLSSIDVIDTAGLAKGSTIELIGRESGSYTLKGSNNVTENFNLSALKDEKTAGVINYVTITNLAVADVITLGDNIVATKTSGASTKNTYFTLTDKNDSKTSYGTLCVTGVASSKFASSSYSGSIKRS